MKLIYILLSILVTINASASAPTVPSSNLYVGSVNGATLNIGWTPGNGTKRIIIAKAGSPVTAIPQNGIDYAENTIFGEGQEITPGEFVVYDNAFTSFYLTGLTPATQYYFAFYEYNGTGASIEYLTTSFLTGNVSTSAAPTIQASNMVFTNITGNTVTVSVTEGDGGRRLILAREGAPVDVEPADLIPYAGDGVFGNGAQVGSGNFSVYSSTGNYVTISNLKPGTQYYFAASEYNGIGEPVYKRPALTANVTTRVLPTIPSSDIQTAITDGTELALNWTPGNGLKRIIIAKKGSSVTAVPTDGIDYTANDIFGNGQAIAPGEFVVYNSNFNATTVKGLDPATNYYFRIFEYDGTGNATLYLKTLYASHSASTAVTPTLQASDLAVNNITANSLNLTWTPGNGKGRFVVAAKNAVVNITPQDLALYDANESFGEGQQIGNGNFVLSYNLTSGLIVSNLHPNTTYHFAVFEYNGLNQPLYLTPAAVFSATTTGALPVKLSQFKAINNNEEIQLMWTTSFEENSSHFTVLRSVDGVHFNFLLSVPAKGNSQAPVNYNAKDINPPSGQLYYKLEMADKDGTKENSPVVNVLFANKSKAFRIMTNPVRDKLQIEFKALNNARNTQWRIINQRGQLIKSGIVSTTNLGVNISLFPAGTYWFQIQGQSNVESKAFIKE